LKKGSFTGNLKAMKTLTLEVPPERDQAELVRLLRLELALAMYREGELSPGCAAELAGMDRWEFADVAKARCIPTPYTTQMVEEDFAHGSRR
jgi:predicted HTH domain antitoxin